MQDTSSKQQTKQTTNPIISRQDHHLTQPCLSEEKQTNKNSAQISPYKKLTQTTGPTLEGRNQREKEFKLETWEKETSNTVSLKKNEKAEKYYTNEGTS